MAEVISLLTSSDDEEASASPASVPAPALTQRAIRPKKRPASRAKRGNWRRRAGDASTASPADPTDAAAGEVATELEASLSVAELRAELLSFGLRPGCRTKAGLAERLGRARRAAAASEALYAHREPRAERYDTARAGMVACGAQLCGCRLCGAAILPPRRTFCCEECVPHLLNMAPFTPAVRPSCSPMRPRCVHFHLLRTSGAHIRKALALRDDKRCRPRTLTLTPTPALSQTLLLTPTPTPTLTRCALCSVDVGPLLAEARRTVRAAAAAGGGPGAAAAALAAVVAGSVFETHARLTGGGDGGKGGGGKRRRGGPRVKEGSFWQADHLVAVHEGGGCCGLANLRTLCTPCHVKVTRAQAGQRAKARRAAPLEEESGQAEEAVEVMEAEEAEEAGDVMQSVNLLSSESDSEAEAETEAGGETEGPRGATRTRLYVDLS